MFLMRLRVLTMILVLITPMIFACAPNAGKDGAAGGSGADGVAGIPGEDGAGSGSAPQSPSVLTADVQSPSRIDLHWVFNTGTELGFNVQRSEIEGEWETIAGTAANVIIYHDESVECENTYSYRVLAYNDYGESAPSSAAAATADFCELDAPADLTAILDDEQDDGSQRSILLSWSQGAGDLPGVPASYEIYRKTFDASWSGTALATQPADQTTYTDEDAACGGTFQYRIRAANENDVKSAFSNTSTSRSDVCPLVDPSNLTATIDQAGSIEITWDINDPDATGYLVQRREHETRADWVTIADLPEGSTSYSDDGAECETAEYDYRLRAYNGDKQSAWIETLTPGSSFCVVDAPSGLLVEADSDTSIQLTWTDNANNETGFRIYRDTALIHTTVADAQTYLDEGRICETDYEYYVEAFNSNVASNPSNTDRTSTSWCPVDAPTGLTASATQVGSVNLAWTDNSNDEMGYYVQRSETGDDTWSTIATLPSDSSSHQDTTATCETQNYDYRVQAYDRNTVSDWSNVATGSSYCTVEAPTGLYANTISPEEIELSWVNNAANATGTRIFREDAELTTLSSDATSYNDTTVDCQTLYRYTMTAYTANVESNPSNTAPAQTDYCPISAPFNVATVGDGNEVTVSWEHDLQYATSFDVQRRVEGEGTWQLLDTVAAPDLNVTDTTVDCYKSYDYRVLAYNSNVGSAWSDLATGAATGCTPVRPRPVLMSISPNSYVALSREYLDDPPDPLYSLAITGQGIAADTQVEVGDFVINCDTQGQGTGCMADDFGQSENCATSCEASIPAEIMKHAGEYVVRLYTPDPVWEGLNTSVETKFFNVVAPQPVIDKIWPRGVLQLLDNYGAPIPLTINMRIWGRNMLDNVQARLGPNFGEVLSIVTDPITGDQEIEALLSTNDLYPRDEPYEFAMSNPSPGGGERTQQFGVNPRIENWDELTTDMRGTRLSGPLPQSWRHAGSPTQMLTNSGLGYNGGAQWVALRDQKGRLRKRIATANIGGAIPFSFGEQVDIQVAGSIGATLAISKRQTLLRGDGTFGEKTDLTMGEKPNAVVAADLDGDGTLDLVTANNLSDDISIRLMGIIPGTWHQELTDSFSDQPDQPWLPKYTEVGFTNLDIHQAAQTVTKVGVRVFLEWTTQPAGSVDFGLTAPDGQMVDMGSHSAFTPWPNAGSPASWRLNKTFREYDFNGETGIDGLVDLHGLQPTDYWTLSIDNQTGASAEVKNFTVLTDGHF